MKILESGRQIEASKMKNTDGRRVDGARNVKYAARAIATAASTFANGTPVSGAAAGGGATPEGALKVAFFEDRIKNIITNALNEDSKNNGAWPVKGFAENVDKASLPDYTQVSPAKLALRRHLSQEKIAPSPPQTAAKPSNFIGTRTIGDLVSGEIERTLEISNQSIINKVVPMCLGAGTSNAGKNEFADNLIQKSLANSYPTANGKHENFNANQNQNQYPKPSSRSSVLYSTSNSQSVPYASKYPTVHLPRTEMKPYHESYFTDMKPPTKEEPVEGYVFWEYSLEMCLGAGKILTLPFCFFLFFFGI